VKQLNDCWKTASLLTHRINLFCSLETKTILAVAFLLYAVSIIGDAGNVRPEFEGPNIGAGKYRTRKIEHAGMQNAGHSNFSLYCIVLTVERSSL